MVLVEEEVRFVFFRIKILKIINVNFVEINDIFFFDEF